MRHLRSLVIVRFLALFVPAFLVATTLALDAIGQYRVNKAEQALAGRMGTVAGQIIGTLTAKSVEEAPDRLRDRLRTLSADSAITCVDIVKDGLIEKSVSWPRNLGCGPMNPELTTTLAAPSDPRMTVRVGYTLDEIAKVRHETRLSNLVTISLALLLTTGLAIGAFYRIVSSPLGRLRDAIHRMGRQREFVPVPVRANDEIGEICTAFNQLHTDLGEERGRAMAALERIDGLYNQTPALLFLIDLDGRITGTSDFWNAETRYNREEILGKPLAKLLDAESRTRLADCILNELAEGRGVRDVPLRIKRKDGRLVDVLLAATVSQTAGADENGKREFVCVMSDVSQLRSVQDRLKHLANTDPLTGLPNRLGLNQIMSDLQKELLAQETPACGCTVMFIDLDNFKTVNDTLGHAAGDYVLQTAARRIGRIIGKDGIVARIGGDEMAVVCPNLIDRNSAGRLASQIISSISSPIEFEGQVAHIGASVGIATCADASHKPEEALRFADQAMYLAKSDGKNRFAFYDTVTASSVTTKSRGVQLIQEGLIHGWFDLHFQPVVSFDTLRPAGVEALLRITQPDHGIASIEDLIRAAEESGQMGMLGEWILERAVKQFLEIIAPRVSPQTYLTVNLSPAQLSQGFVERVRTVIKDHPSIRDRLVFEITETAAVKRFDETCDLLNALRALGTRIAIDDFGTGHSSLSYVSRLPIDIIKLDRSFTNRISQKTGSEDRRKQMAMVETMVTLARALKVDLIAEGVEDEDTITILKDAGVPKGQGYVFSPALAAGAAAQWLALHDGEKRKEATGSRKRA